MSTRLDIVQAGPRHAGLIAPLFDAYRQFYGQPADLARARQFIEERLQRGESVIFLALDGVEALGFTQLYPTFSSVSLNRLWILNDLFVIPGARRAGVARALLERARQWAVQTGAQGLMLETAVDNLPAQRLYEQMGWIREEAFYTYYLTVAP